MARYVANRDDVCAGVLIKLQDMIYRTNNSSEYELSNIDLYKNGTNKIKTSNGTICRIMLFNVTSNNLANDLIYTTPVNYPINGITEIANIKSNFIIENYLELGELLKYSKYKDKLTQSDLIKIFKKIISSEEWLSKNYELFGLEKSRYGYVLSGVSTLPFDTFQTLKGIVELENTKPSNDEPGYKLIKKLK